MVFAYLDKEKREREAQERAAAKERGEKPARPRNKFDEKSEYENRLELKEAALTACVAQHSAPVLVLCLAEQSPALLLLSLQNSYCSEQHLLCWPFLLELLSGLCELP